MEGATLIIVGGVFLVLYLTVRLRLAERDRELLLERPAPTVVVVEREGCGLVGVIVAIAVLGLIGLLAAL